MEYKLSFFNSIFELMTAYNFAYVCIREIHTHTQYLYVFLRRSLLADFSSFNYEQLIESNKIATKKNPLLNYKNYKFEEKLIREINIYARRINKPESIDQIRKKIIPLYLYCGFYCFVVLYIGGIMEYDDYGRRKLFGFLHIYNLILFPFIIILLFRKKYLVKTAVFIFTFILHLIVTIYIWETSLYKLGLFEHKSTITKIFNLIKDNNLASFLFFLSYFFAYQLVYYDISIGFSLKPHKLMKTLLWNTVYFSLSWIYIHYVGGNLKINEPYIIKETIILCFFPIFLLIVRFVADLLFVTCNFLSRKLYLDRFAVKFLEDQVVNLDDPINYSDFEQ